MKINEEISEQIKDLIAVEEGPRESFGEALLRIVKLGVQARRKNGPSDILARINAGLREGHFEPIPEYIFDSIHLRELDGTIAWLVYFPESRAWRVKCSESEKALEVYCKECNARKMFVFDGEVRLSLMQIYIHVFFELGKLKQF